MMLRDGAFTDHIDWEQVADTRAELPDLIDEEIENEDEGRYIGDSVPHYPQMGESRKIKRLSIRIAIEIIIELWAWLAETGKGDELSWPLWDSLGINSTNPLCEYSVRRWRKLQKRRLSRCDFCPYMKHYGHNCVDPSEPFPQWRRSDHEDDRKFYAKEFLRKLIALQKEIILNTDKFK